MPRRTTGMSRIADSKRGDALRSAADPPRHAGGTWVALMTRFSLATAVTLSGCLITQPVHFDPPANSPPAIYDSPTGTFPISQIIRPPPPMPSDGGVTRPPITLEVIVADPDIDQRLRANLRIDANRLTSLPDIMPSTATMNRDRRTERFYVELMQLDPTRCHRVDLFVSSDFQGGSNPPRAVEALDLAQATWWIQLQTGVDMATCQ